MTARRTDPDDLDFLRRLGGVVHVKRQRQGFTARELAERSGLSRRFIALLEAGDGNASATNLRRLARALGVTLADLLTAADGPPARRPIALLGLRGAGKSTLGAKAAKRAALPFVELDAVVERSAGLALAEIFAVHGEQYFRRVEREALREVVDADPPALIATGGGIVASADTFALLRERCVTVWLKATPEDHWNRVVAQGDHRPITSRPDAKAELRSILAARAPLYAQADHVIDTSHLDVEEAVAALVEIAKQPA